MTGPAGPAAHVLLQHGRVRLVGDARRLTGEHLRLTGRADESTEDGLPPGLDRGALVECTVTGRRVTAVIRRTDPEPTAHWITETPTLEDLLLAYLRSAPAHSHPATEAAACYAAFSSELPFGSTSSEVLPCRRPKPCSKTATASPTRCVMR